MGGPWLDQRFHTAPWFKILGYVIGIGAPINAFVRIVRDYNRSLKNDQSKPHDGPDQHPDDR
jgi:F0F1-type ATP synthase assembly protein I